MIEIRIDFEGTTAGGTERGDEAGRILRRSGGFLWSRARGTWVHNRNWHYGTRLVRAHAALAALTAAGIEATLEEAEVQVRYTTAEEFAEVEAAERERAAERVERYEARAEKLAAESAATYAQASERAERIPFGQPILVDHYSAGRDRRYREKIARGYEKAFAAADEAREYERRAGELAAAEARRGKLGPVLRRIEKLRKEHASWKAQSPYAQAKRAELAAEIAALETEVAAREEAGEKVWARKDFTPGDWARVKGSWMQVVKANPKTLALETGHMPWPLKYEYSFVTGRRSAEEGAPS